MPKSRPEGAGTDEISGWKARPRVSLKPLTKVLTLPDGVISLTPLPLLLATKRLPLLSKARSEGLENPLATRLTLPEGVTLLTVPTAQSLTNRSLLALKPRPEGMMKPRMKVLTLPDGVTSLIVPLRLETKRSPLELMASQAGPAVKPLA